MWTRVNTQWRSWACRQKCDYNVQEWKRSDKCTSSEDICLCKNCFGLAKCFLFMLVSCYFLFCPLRPSGWSPLSLLCCWDWTTASWWPSHSPYWQSYTGHRGNDSNMCFSLNWNLKAAVSFQRAGLICALSCFLSLPALKLPSWVTSLTRGSTVTSTSMKR